MAKSTAITIREALINDAPAIAEVQVSAWKSAYRGVIPDPVLDAYSVEERTARWKNILTDSSGMTFVASISGQVIGWSGFGASRDDDRSDETCEVYGFYVHPNRWRSGAGRLLWTATAERLKSTGYTIMDAWVLEANGRARRFYESMGCILDSNAKKMFEGEGYALPEVRYSFSL